MSAQAIARPHCPKCNGTALYPWFTIVEILDHVKCLYCGWHAYPAFTIRKPTATETKGETTHA
jgi:Zn ribbon nucleic-acid-binding protein